MLPVMSVIPVNHWSIVNLSWKMKNENREVINAPTRFVLVRIATPRCLNAK